MFVQLGVGAFGMWLMYKIVKEEIHTITEKQNKQISLLTQIHSVCFVQGQGKRCKK